MAKIRYLYIIKHTEQGFMKAKTLRHIACCAIALLACVSPVFADSTFPINIELKDSLGKREYRISHPVPDGNYRITLTLGCKRRAGRTTVMAENRRMMVNDVATRKGETRTVSFTVNKHSAYINERESVRLKQLEKRFLNWDANLDLLITGQQQAVTHIRIEPDTTACTVFLCGNSTVVDQDADPWCSWGQVITQWFTPEASVCNLAMSGESATSFIDERRLSKATSMMRAGDYVLIEFGHNDQKQKFPGSGAYYNYATALKTFIDQARMHGATPILITPTRRRVFNKEGHVTDTHADYPEAMRWVAEREGVALIDLQELTGQLYEALGVEGSKTAFVHYPANTFPGQEKALADNTHFNPYGATQIAKCVVQGIRSLDTKLKQYIANTFPTDYSPTRPDSPETFLWPTSQEVLLSKPEGN